MSYQSVSRGILMAIWHINGGNKLRGSCFVQGSKNAALPIIAASVICGGETELLNVPQLSDVTNSLRILRQLGCTAEQQGNDVYINSNGISSCRIPAEISDNTIFIRCSLSSLSQLSSQSAPFPQPSSRILMPDFIRQFSNIHGNHPCLFLENSS